MINLQNIKYVLISVIGPHAGESENKILNRKIQDINNVGFTFWLIKSYRAKPKLVREFCLEANAKGTECYCVFIESATKKGAIPTKSAYSAKEYSIDNINWSNLPRALTPVTGRLPAYGLIFNHLELMNGEIDLWNYVDFFNQKEPLKIIQGASTICAIKKDDTLNHVGGIKSRFRKVIAIGKLCKPFCVYLR